MGKKKPKNNEFGYVEENEDDKDELAITASSDAIKLLLQKLGERSTYLQNRTGKKDLSNTEVFIENLMEGIANREEKAMTMLSDLLKFTTKQELLNQEERLLTKLAEDKTKEARYTLLNALSLFGYLSFADFHKNKDRYNISMILLEGGRYAGKTFSAGDYVIFRTLDRLPLIPEDQIDEDNIRHIKQINAGRGGQIFCGRAVEGDVEGSVFAIVSNRITTMGLTKLFDIKKSQNQIVCKHNGVIMNFTGFNKLVENNNEGMKGWENAFLVWVDEAQSVSMNILQKVYNTIIRTSESILLMTMNRQRTDDDAYVLATELFKSTSYIQRFCYEDNPFLDPQARKMAETAKVEQPVYWRREYLGIPDLTHHDSYFDVNLLSRMQLMLNYEDVKHTITAKVIAIDPADVDAKAETANEWGLIAIGKAYDPITGTEKYYKLEDFSNVFTDINKVFELIVAKCLEYDIRTIVYERNGVGASMSSFDNFLFYKKQRGELDQHFSIDKQQAWAKGKKENRHGVLAEFCQRGIVFFLADRKSMLLEQQMQQCTPRGYMGKGSPDRVDAFTLGVGNLSHLENQSNISRIFKLSMFGEKPNEEDRWVRQPTPLITVGNTGFYTGIIVFYIYIHYDTKAVKIYSVNYTICESMNTVQNVLNYKRLYKLAKINLEDTHLAKSDANNMINEGEPPTDIFYIRWADKYKNGNFTMKVDLVAPYIANGFLTYPLDIEYINYKNILDNWLIRDFLEYDIDKKEESPIIKTISNVIQGVFQINA